MSNVLIYIDHTKGQPRPSTLAGITFGRHYAEKSGGHLHLAVIGHGVDSVIEAVKGYGAQTIHVIDAPCFEHFLTESFTPALALIRESCAATMVAGVAGSTTKDLLARLSARLGAAMVSDVESVIDSKTFTRPMWAGNVEATVELTTPVKFATVRGTEFDAPTTMGEADINNLDFSVDLSTLKSQFVSLQEVKNERPDVTTAKVVVSGGRGVKSAEGFKVIEDLADKLGAGIGASRAVCDSGWVPADWQIGQTGKVVAPDLYFAIGISGAIQHLAGMKGSKVIVAINTDADAPIFQVADYGLVADLFKAVPEILESL
jgi:electron transfer flavoprotein alpha subunit